MKCNSLQNNSVNCYSVERCDGLDFHMRNSVEQTADGISLPSFNDEFNEILDSKYFAAKSAAKFICLRDQEDCLHIY